MLSVRRLPSFAAILLATACLAAPQLTLVGDRYTLRGAPLELSWNASTGALVSARDSASGLALLKGPSLPFDLHTSAGWAFSTSAARATELGGLILDGQWDFHIEGGAPRKLNVPGAWEDQGVTDASPNDPNPAWKPYNGNAFYSRTFDVPEALRGKDLVLLMGPVDDFDWTSLNGREIGHTGEDTPAWYSVQRRYPLPAADLKPTGNLLEVKVYDRGGEGGINGSVLLMTAEQEKQWRTMPLHVASAKLSAAPDAAIVTLTYEVKGWTIAEEWTISLTRPFASRRVDLTVADASVGTPTFDSLHLNLGSLDPALASGRLSAPYTWPPLDRPVADFTRDGSLSLESSSQIPGMTVALPKPARCFTVGQYWERDGHRFEARGNGNAIDLSGTYDVTGRLKPGLHFSAGGQFLTLVPGDSSAGLRAIGESWERLGFKRPPMSDWAKQIALYSAYPCGTMGGGLADLRSPGDKPSSMHNFQTLQLPTLKKLGINAIWFLPLWPMLYGVSDYYTVDPSNGTVDDLKAFVADAHSAGIRVLCDLIPHGPHESGGFMKVHPEQVSRHEDGSILYWWGCLSCDYANPGWQQYMGDVSVYWAKTADIDGWRVDCAGGGPQNWRPYGDNLPSASGTWGGLGVMRKSREALDAFKPGCAFLAESPEPMMLSQSQFIYDWPLESLFWASLDGPMTTWVHDIRGWLEDQRLALPPGAAHGLMRFTENHDQLRGSWQLGPDVAHSIWALCTLAEGFPLIYQEQEIGHEDLWSGLLHTRAEVPDLHLGEAHYLALRCDRPEVLPFVRTTAEGASLVAINFSGSAQHCRLAWPGAPANLAFAKELPTGRSLSVRRSSDLGVEMDVPAWGWSVAVLRPKAADLAAFKPMNGMESVTVAPAASKSSARSAVVTVAGKTSTLTSGSIDQTSGDHPRATVTVGDLKLDWQDGLLASLSIAGKQLLAGMMVQEGDPRVFMKGSVSLAATADGHAVPPAAGSTPAVFKPGPWSVRIDNGATTLAYRSAGDEVSFASEYKISPDGAISMKLTLTPREDSEPVLGRLYTAFLAPRGSSPDGADRWSVHTIEGDVGGPFVVRHPTAHEFTARFWHPIQRLWEHSVLPLSLDRPALAWQSGGHWLWFDFPSYPGDGALDDAYLREYGPDESPGLAATFAWMEGRHGRALSKAEPFRLDLDLYTDSEPRWRYTYTLPVRFHTEGANWYAENDHYRAVIRRSKGGELTSLCLPGSDKSVVGAPAFTYTDFGLLGKGGDSMGTLSNTVGTSAGDLEPDCWVEGNPTELRLHFRSYLRDTSWAGVTSPRIEYETIWHLSASPRIHVEHRVRPMVGNGPPTAAFLAQVLPLPAVSSWTAVAEGTAYSGSPAKDPPARVIESSRLGKPISSFAITTAAGKLHLDDLKPWGEGPQNVFLLRSGDGPTYSLFLAMLSGAPVPLDARWRGFSYDLSVTR